MKRWIAGLGVCAFLSAPAIVLAGEKLFFFDEADWETFSTMAEREDVILIQEYRKGLRAWVKNDFETAAKIFLTLAGAGVAEAQYFLAGLYVNGEGVAKDFEEAMLWYERAAITGLPAAQTDLAFGYSLMNKEQASDDYEKGLSWMQKAAQPGNPKAYYGLGRIYDLDRKSVV